MSPEGEGRFSREGHDYKPLAARLIIASQVKETWMKEQLLQKQSGIKGEKSLCTEVFISGLLIRNMVMLIKKTVTYMSTEKMIN